MRVTFFIKDDDEYYADPSCCHGPLRLLRDMRAYLKECQEVQNAIVLRTRLLLISPQRRHQAFKRLCVGCANGSFTWMQSKPYRGMLYRCSVCFGWWKANSKARYIECEAVNGAYRSFWVLLHTNLVKDLVLLSRDNEPLTHRAVSSLSSSLSQGTSTKLTTTSTAEKAEHKPILAPSDRTNALNERHVDDVDGNDDDDDDQRIEEKYRVPLPLSSNHATDAINAIDNIAGDNSNPARPVVRPSYIVLHRSHAPSTSSIKSNQLVVHRSFIVLHR
jgi:hypothetical protein